MISFLQFLVNDLAAVHPEGEGWLLDTICGEFLRARQGKKGAFGAGMRHSWKTLRTEL